MPITVPGYSSSDRVPRVAFALLLGQGSRTPAQSPLEVFLVGPRAYNAAGDTVLGSQADAEPLQVYSANDAADAWGAGSPLHRMAQRLLSSYRGATLWGVSAAKDVAATRSSYAVAITGIATAAGELKYAVCDTIVSVAVESANTNDQVGTALAAAISANTSLPLWAAYDDLTDTLTLTVKWYGPTGGSASFALDLDAVSVPAGLTVGAPVKTNGTVDALWAAAYDAAFATGVMFDYVCPAVDDVTVLTSGDTSLRAKIAARLAPTVGHLVTAVMGRVDDAPADAHALTTAWDQGTTDWNETGYWSQVFWAANNRAEPWCVAAAALGLRVQAEESSPQANWIGLQGGPVAPSLKPPLSASLVPTEAEIQQALLYGLSPIRYDLPGESCHLVLSETCKHELGGADDLTLLENTNVPAVCRAVSYGLRTSIALAYSGCAVVADVDGEAPDDLPAKTTSPSLIRAFLLSTMKRDYQSKGWVQRVDEHAVDTTVEQDAGSPSRILYELPIDVSRWVTQIVGVHREIGGEV